MTLEPDSHRRALLAAIAGAALLPGCGGSARNDAPRDLRFTADGLPGRIVRRLRPAPDGLLAATDSGAWRRGGDGWRPLGLTGQAVQDIAAIDANHFVACLGAGGLVETRDRGLVWRDVAGDFGGDGAERMHALLFDAPRARLLATGHGVLAESNDLGRHWRVLDGDWQAFAGTKDALAVDARGDVWWGGQDAIEGWTLQRTRRAGGGDSHPRLLPSPSTVKGLLVPPGAPGRVLASGEGGIVQTRDDGASWQPLLLDTDHRFYFDVVQDPLQPRRFVTASWAKNFDTPQPLVIEWSDDDGARWQRAEHPARDLFGGAWSLAARVERGAAVFYAGLYRGGVMRFELP